MPSASCARGSRSALILAFLLPAAPVAAQVDCSDPDNLCTGDPCIITASAVSDPCTVDFGSRAVIIAHRLHVRALDLTARTIAVQAPIVNEITVRLFSDETIDLDGDIVGAAHLEAGGDINVRRPIKGGTANGIGLEAGNDINVSAPIKSGNILNVIAGNDIDVRGPVRAEMILFEAGGRLVLDRSVFANAKPFTYSPDPVTFHGATGVDLNATVNARGGDIEVVSAAGDVNVNKGLRTDGTHYHCHAGFVTITAAATARVNRTISASGRCGAFFSDGGTIRIDAATVNVGSAARFRATARGDIRLAATGGDMLLAGRYFAPSGGTIEGTATGNLLASGGFSVAPGGCIGLSAGGTLDTTGATFDTPLSADCPGSPSGAFLD